MLEDREEPRQLIKRRPLNLAEIVDLLYPTRKLVLQRWRRQGNQYRTEVFLIDVGDSHLACLRNQQLAN